MLKKIYSLFLAILGACLLITCAEDTNPQFEIDKFTSIFDQNNFDAAFSPVDIQQTADGGYVIVSERKLPDTRLTGIYLLKVDKRGNFEKELEVGDTLINPVGKLARIGDKFYFFCMETTVSTGAPAAVKLASFSAALDDFSAVAVEGLTYPGAASLTAQNQFVLLSYNNDAKESVITLVSPDGSTGASKGFTVGVGDKSEEPIMNHYLKLGRQFPFEAGVVSGNICYFNGFYDYTFSLVFTDLSADEPIGIVQGQDDDGGFGAVVPLGAGKFAASRFNFGANFFLLNPAIDVTGISSSTGLEGYTLPELIPDAKVRILSATINDKKVLIYASDTQSRQIGLYFYDQATGAFLSSRYLGFSNPFEISNLIQTEDGGLAVCGTTYLAGRFPRICLFKLSKQDMSGSAKQQ